MGGHGSHGLSAEGRKDKVKRPEESHSRSQRQWNAQKLKTLPGGQLGAEVLHTLAPGSLSKGYDSFCFKYSVNINVFQEKWLNMLINRTLT